MVPHQRVTTNPPSNIAVSSKRPPRNLDYMVTHDDLPYNATPRLPVDKLNPVMLKPKSKRRAKNRFAP